MCIKYILLIFFSLCPFPRYQSFAPPRFSQSKFCIDCAINILYSLNIMPFRIDELWMPLQIGFNGLKENARGNGKSVVAVAVAVLLGDFARLWGADSTVQLNLMRSRRHGILGLWNLDNKLLATTCGKHNYKLPNDRHNSYKKTVGQPWQHAPLLPPSPSPFLCAHNEAINLKAANKKINKSRRFVCLSLFPFCLCSKNNFIPCCLPVVVVVVVLSMLLLL